MNIRLIAVGALACSSLAGCIAAAPVAMYAISAASLGWAGYNMYSAGNIENAEYKVKRAEPSAANLQEIQSASTLAIYPTKTEVDGVVVDTFRQQSGMEVISSRITIDVVEQTGVDQTKLLAYPYEDRAMEIRTFASKTGSDLIVLAVVSGAQADANIFMPGLSKTSFGVNCKLISGKTGAVLLEEEHEIKVDVGDAPGNTEIAQIASQGISDRLRELRSPGGQTAYFSESSHLLAP